ncbi:neprilysin-1-like [Amblyomma americanum]
MEARPDSQRSSGRRRPASESKTSLQLYRLCVAPLEGMSSTATPALGSSSARARARIRRWKLARPLLVAAATIGILLVPLAWLLSPRHYRRSEQAPCWSSSCRSYVQELRAAMDIDVNPCEDFYAFVCSRWTPVAGGRTRLEDAQLLFQQTVIKRAKLVRAPSNNQSAFEKAATFYQSCLANNDGIDYLRAFLEKVQLPWPSVHPDIDPLEVIFDLSFNYQFPLFFFVYALASESQLRLVFLSSFLGVNIDTLLAEHRSRADNARHICELREALSKGVPRKGSGHTQNHSAWCSHLAQLQSSIFSHLEKYRQRNWMSYSSVSELAEAVMPSAHKDRWLRIMAKSSRRNTGIRISTPVDVDNPDYLRAFFAILANTSREQMLLVVGLSLVEAAGRFADAHLATRIYGESTARGRHAIFCFHLTDAAMPQALSFPHPLNLHTPPRLGKVTEVAKVVREAAINHLRRSTWLGPASKKILTTKIANARIVFRGLGRAAANAAAVIPPMTANFFENIELLPRSHWTRQNHLFAQGVDGDEWTDLWHQANASYAPHNIIIPDVYLLSNVFPDGAYESISYSSVGSLIARQIAAAYDLKGRTFSGGSSPQRWMTAGETARQESTINCLVQAFQTQHNTTNVTLTEDMSALYVTVASLPPLFNALKHSGGYPDWSTGFGRYSAEELFFLSLCYQSCAGFAATESVFSAAAWCNFPLSVFKPFADSFHCPEGSAMISLSECGEL